MQWEDRIWNHEPLYLENQKDVQLRIQYENPGQNTVIEEDLLRVFYSDKNDVNV